MRGIDIYEDNQRNSLDASKEDQGYALVVKIAKHFKRKLPSHIELNDLIQSGYVGLLEAKKNFKPDVGVTFDTFASNRIKGAMIDDMRKNSWGTRESLRQLKLMGDAIHRIEQRTQQQATPDAVAKELNISVEEHLKASQKIAIAQVMSMSVLEEVNALPGNDEDPEEINEREEIQQKIKSLLMTLPEREKLILSLYYVEELTLKEISEVLELTEARICQLHAQALARLKTKLMTSKALAPA